MTNRIQFFHSWLSQADQGDLPSGQSIIGMFMYGLSRFSLKPSMMLFQGGSTYRNQTCVSFLLKESNLAIKTLNGCHDSLENGGKNLARSLHHISIGEEGRDRSDEENEARECCIK